MPTVKMKPTSPGRRGVVQISREGLHKGRPFPALTEAKVKKLVETMRVE